MARPTGTRELELGRSLPAGLERIPYQLARFEDVRNSALRRALEQPALASWRPADGDPGLLLIELWAYVADVVSLYEELLINESFVATAQEESSIRDLVALLGYVPRPAIAHEASLVVDASRALTIPAGFAVRSQPQPEIGAQTFEVARTTRIGRVAQRHRVRGVSKRANGVTQTRQLVVAERSLAVQRGARIVVDTDEGAFVVTATTVRRHRDASRRRLLALRTSDPVRYRDPESIAIRAPQRRAVISGGAGDEVELDRVYDHLTVGARVVVGNTLVTVEQAQRRFRREKTGEQTVDDEVTEFFADLPYTWARLSSSVGGVRLHYDLREVADMVEPLLTEVGGDGDTLVGVEPPVEDTPFPAVLRDADGRVHEVHLESVDGRVRPVTTLPSLRAPLEVFTATVDAVQGESHAEDLGAGEGRRGQVLVLSRGPLTYTADRSPNTPHGFSSSLRVTVDGIEWREVPSLYRVGERDRVFIVRQRDDGKAELTFGGAPIPSGSRVRAEYRVGAGGPPVPASAIDKPVEALAGLDAIFNAGDADGGGDGESADRMRVAGPRSTLTLGRIVSLPDLQAEALRLPGTVAATAGWAWDGHSQRAAAVVWFVGSSSHAVELEGHLRGLADPELRLEVRTAVAVPHTLALQIEVSPDRDAGPVLERVEALLLGQRGQLAPERLGIGQPLLRTALLAWVYGVQGVRRVADIRVDGVRFDEPGLRVEAGQWLDFVSDGRVLINGQEVARG